MNTRQMEYFVAIAEERQITAAAARLPPLRESTSASRAASGETAAGRACPWARTTGRG